MIGFVISDCLNLNPTSCTLKVGPFPDMYEALIQVIAAMHHTHDCN